MQNESSTDQSSRSPLARFGDYELIEEIARGGMGVVFKARQTSLGRMVAIKMILAGRLASEVEILRFREEARAAAALQYPNIVAIHEVGEIDGQHFFSMDLIEGRNLAEVVQDAPFTPMRAAACVRDLAGAIHYAHERGILHRDLKPSNVLLDRADRPHVTDFGLAKRIEGGVELTLTGQFLGSPHYMPPEQAAGKHAHFGPSSDVYSLGAILYFLLTGRPPFAAKTVTDTLRQLMNAEPISPRQLNPTVPRDLETICLKCLEKEPQHRYATAQHLIEDLGCFLQDEPVRARPVSMIIRFWRRGQRKPVYAGATIAAVILLLAAIYGLSRPSSEHHLADQILIQRAREARRGFLREKSIPERDLHCPRNVIDLTDYYNAGLVQNWHGDVVGNDLSELPRGLQRLAGVEFDVRGLIQLASQSTRHRKEQGLPKQMTQIRLGLPCRRVHVLHATTQAEIREGNDGKQVGSYIIHFSKQRSWEIPLVYGRDLRDWWVLKYEPLEASHAVLAWSGTNPWIKDEGGRLRVFKSTWESPLPGAVADSIDFISSMAGPAPFVIAITVE